MINVAEITSTKGMEQAQKQMEQTKNRVALEKKKANDEKRKFENHHKFIMGGAVHKYFKECFSFEESEINEILEVHFKTAEVKKNISDIRGNAPKNVFFSPKETVREQIKADSLFKDYLKEI